MTITKTMTEKARAANRVNAQKSTGPRDTAASSQNAQKHGLLSKYLHFESDEEEQQFEALLLELEREHQPVGITERALLDDVAVCLRNLGRANEWIQKEMENRRRAAGAILKQLSNNDDGKQLILSDPYSCSSPGPAQLGWDCHELTVRNAKDGVKRKGVFGSGDKTNQLSIEAKLTSSLDTILRYQSAIKRDFYRALAELREIRRERKGS
jgi:hypothetical protein